MSVAVPERMSGGMIDVVFDGERTVGGRAMRIARTVSSLGLRLLVEHPEHGWTRTSDARLAEAERWLNELPEPTPTRPLRFRIDGYADFTRGVATTAWDAALHAGFLATDRQQPRVAVDEGVTLIHREPGIPGGFALWSDGMISRTQGLSAAEAPCSLEVAARELIRLVRGSDSDEPAVGYATLCRVAEVRTREEIAASAPGGGRLRDRIERLRVIMVDGDERDLWVRSRRYPDGYQCEVHGQMPDDWYADAQGRPVCPTR